MYFVRIEINAILESPFQANTTARDGFIGEPSVWAAVIAAQGTVALAIRAAWCPPPSTEFDASSITAMFYYQP